MFYTMHGRVVWSAHFSAHAAWRSAFKLSAKWPKYGFGVRMLRHRWYPGDNPNPRHYMEAPKCNP